METPSEFNRRRFCSASCYHKYNVGSNHGNYRGGLRRGHDGGYLRVTGGGYLHRIVMERHLGRRLYPQELIHHKDGDVTNNDIENLELTNNSLHRKEHCKTQARNSKGRFC